MKTITYLREEIENAIYYINSGKPEVALRILDYKFNKRKKILPEIEEMQPGETITFTDKSSTQIRNKVNSLMNLKNSTKEFMVTKVGNEIIVKRFK